MAREGHNCSWQQRGRSFKTGCVPIFEKGDSFICMQQWLDGMENDYDSYSDDSYSIGDEMEDFKYSEDDESTDELDMPYWVTAVSLIEKFVPEESDCEERDSDYEIPVSDDYTDTEIKEHDVEEQMGSIESEDLLWELKLLLIKLYLCGRKNC